MQHEGRQESSDPKAQGDKVSTGTKNMRILILRILYLRKPEM